LKKTKLKPYVHKIKGAKNHALYDLLKGNFYTLSPGGDAEQLKDALKEAGLTFETGGVVPFKTTIDMKHEKESITIMTLQVRLNGGNEDNCWNRKKIDKKKRVIKKETLLLLREQLNHIPVKTFHIEAETNDRKKIEYILTDFPFTEARVIVQKDLNKSDRDRMREICENRNAIVTFMDNGRENMQELKVEIYSFFYNQHFNPCLGKQVAVDCRGEIKPCLWWKDTLGNIGENDLKDMINAGVFDKYWELTKDKIDVCKDCELRCACMDCRINPSAEKDFLTTGKPVYCSYNPYIGEYETVMVNNRDNK
jgi:radical SAM protein with 4Fe4S-binding SPASM domain